MSAFVGKWKMESKENMEVFETKFGCPDDIKPEIINNMVIELQDKGDNHWCSRTIIGEHVAQENNYKFGETFTLVLSSNGLKGKCVRRLEGEDVVETIESEVGNLTTRYRLTNGKMVHECTMGDIKGCIYYVRV